MTGCARIGLIGKAGSGKSTAATILGRELGFQHCRTGKLCRDVTRLVFGDEETSHLHRVSDALQMIDEGIFLDSAIRGVDLGLPVVIDAIRFDHDVTYARANGFALVRVRMDETLRFTRLESRGQVRHPGSSSAHPIETALDRLQVDFEIMNDGTVASLAEAILAVARDTGAQAV